VQATDSTQLWHFVFSAFLAPFAYRVLNFL
jgi:hypothetical protein